MNFYEVKYCLKTVYSMNVDFIGNSILLNLKVPHCGKCLLVRLVIGELGSVVDLSWFRPHKALMHAIK